MQLHGLRGLTPVDSNMSAAAGVFSATTFDASIPVGVIGNGNAGSILVIGCNGGIVTWTCKKTHYTCKNTFLSLGGITFLLGIASTTLTLSDGKIILCRLEEVGRAIFRTLESIFPRFDDEMTVLRGRIGIPPPLLVNRTTCLSWLTFKKR